MMNKVGIVIIIGMFIGGFASENARAGEVLTWADCLKESAKNNPDLIAAGEQVKQSVASKNATGSALFPQVNSSVSAGKSSTKDAGSDSTTSDSYGYGVSASQLIFDGGKTMNSLRSAKEALNASKQNFRFTSSTVRYNLRSAFIDLLRMQEMMRIAKEIYDIRRGNLELISLRYASGLEHKGALMTAEADVESAQYGISQVARQLQVAQRRLANAMGRKELSPIAASGDFGVKENAKDKPDLEGIAKNHPSLKQAAARKSSARFGLNSAYANFAPTLSADTGVGKNGSAWTPRGGQWNFGLGVSLPIFEGGLRLAQVAEADALLKQYEANEISTKDSVLLTLEQAWALLQDAVDFAQVQKKSLEANVERSRISQAQYSIGFISFDNWTIIEDNLVSAKRTFLDAEAAALYAEAAWIQAKGETLEYE